MLTTINYEIILVSSIAYQITSNLLFCTTTLRIVLKCHLLFEITQCYIYNIYHWELNDN